MRACGSRKASAQQGGRCNAYQAAPAPHPPDGPRCASECCWRCRTAKRVQGQAANSIRAGRAGSAPAQIAMRPCRSPFMSPPWPATPAAAQPQVAACQIQGRQTRARARTGRPAALSSWRPAAPRALTALLFKGPTAASPAAGPKPSRTSGCCGSRALRCPWSCTWSSRWGRPRGSPAPPTRPRARPPAARSHSRRRWPRRRWHCSRRHRQSRPAGPHSPRSPAACRGVTTHARTHVRPPRGGGEDRTGRGRLGWQQSG